MCGCDGNNGCWWIIILIVLFVCCGCGGYGNCGGGCGCNNNGSGCGCYLATFNACKQCPERCELFGALLHLILFL